MKLADLYKQLDSLGYPVAYYSFKKKQTLPFIVYYAPETRTLSADNEPLLAVSDVFIELYIADKDEVGMAAEEKIKQMLKENEILWSSNEVFVESEKVFQITFSIQLMEVT